jgi:hypothetical protein
MKSKLLRFFLIVVVLVMVLLALLPRIASSGWVTSRVVKAVNERAPVEIGIGDLSLRWFGGARVSDISVHDPASDTDVAIVSVQLERGVLALARDYTDLGTITITEPRVTVHLAPPADLRSPAPAEEPKTSSSPPGEAGAPAVAGKSGVALPPIRVQLDINNGSVQLARDGAAAETVVTDLNLHLDLKGAEDPLAVALQFAMADGNGSFQAEGDIHPGADPMVKMNLEAADLDLARLSELASGFAGVPRASGVLNGRFTADGRLEDGVRITGTVSVPGLQLAGGPLGTDTPNLGDLLLNVDSTVGRSSVSISNLILRTSVARLSASGHYDDKADSELIASGTIDAARLLTELPATLKVREGIVVDEGIFKVSTTVNRSGETVKLVAVARMDTLTGRAGERAIAWTAPTELDVRATHGPDSMRLDHFSLRSPFLRGEGQGDLDKMTLALEGDLAATLLEAGKFIDLDAWGAAGGLNATVTVAAIDLDSRAIECTVAITGAELRREGTVLVPRSDLTCSLLSTVAGLSQDSGPKPRLEKPRVRWKAWLGEGRFSAASVTPPAAPGALPILEEGELSIRLELPAVTDLLQEMGSLPADSGFAGAAVLDLEIGSTADILRFGEGACRLSKFAYRAGEKSLELAEAQMKFAGEFDSAEQQLALSSLQLEFDPGTITMKDVTVPLKTPDQLAAALTAELEIEKLLTMLGGFVSLPENTVVAGTTSLSATIKPGDAGAQVVGLEGALRSLKVTANGENLIDDDDADLSLALTRQLDGSAVRVDKISFTSTPATLTGKAAYAIDGSRKHLTTDGDLTLDLNAATDYLKSLLGMDLLMSGKDASPFHVESAWTGEPGEGFMDGATIHAGFKADQIKAFGLDVQGIELPLQVKDGVASATLAATVNEGQMSVQPEIDFTMEKQALVLLDPTNLLFDVAVTEEVANDLLALIHPLFKRATNVSGKMDLQMDSFTWPLDSERRNDAVFSGTLSFRELKLGTSGMLKTLLEAMKVRESQMEIGDLEIRFSCRDGKIECSPLKLKVEGHEVTIGGTVGLDQSLDYTAKIPVTERLVGKDVYPYLEGTTINAPIGGTVSDPQLDSTILTRAIAGLVKQAAKKQVVDQAGKLFEKLLTQ